MKWSASQDYVLGRVFCDYGQAEEGATRIQRVAQVRCRRPPTTPRTGSVVEPGAGSFTCSQKIPLSPLPPNIRPQVIGKWEGWWHLLCSWLNQTLRSFLFLQIGMMVELARQPPNLDNLINEGIAFAIDRFQVSLPDFPIGMRPVMIGRRKPAYNTIDKVMGRLNRVMMVLETMRHIAVVNVHWEFY